MMIVPLPRRTSALRERDCPRVGVIRGRRRDVAHGVEGLGLGARDEQRPPAGDDPRRDRGYLGRRFAKPENDFRKSLAQLTLHIDACEAQVLEGRRDASLRRSGRRRQPGQPCPPHRLEQFL